MNLLSLARRRIKTLSPGFPCKTIMNGEKVVRAFSRLLRGVSGTVERFTLLILVTAFTFGPRALAQAPDDAKRLLLEGKIAALQPLACSPTGSAPDPQVTALKGVLDAYAQQYSAVLDAQITALQKHQAPNLSVDDQDVIADSRQKKRNALADVCSAPARTFTAANGAVPPPAARVASIADKFEITPSVVRAGQQEVSEQGESSVTIKNNNDGDVRLGPPEVCLEDETTCRPQGEIFQVADGPDKCKNPLANSDHCTLKILFTPHRSFDYSHWLKVPLRDANGAPGPPLMIPLQGKGFVSDMAHVEATNRSANHPSLRSVVGLDIGGATATDTQQKLFVDFALSAPIGRGGYTVCSDSEGEALTNSRGEVLPKTKLAANIVTIVQAGNTVTITTHAPHNLVVGDHVTIEGVSEKSFDGTFEVTGTSDSTHFTYTPNVAANASSKNGKVLKSRGWVVKMASIARSKNVVTVTTQTQHFFAVGDPVVVATQSGPLFINGTFVVSGLDKKDTTKFMFALTGTDAPDSAATGTASLYDKLPAGSVVRGYEDCQDLRTARERTNHVRYGWKDQHADPLAGREWWYFNPRITSVPQQASALSSLNVQGFTDSFSAKNTSLVQGVDVQGGIEILLVKPREGRAFYGSYKNTKARVGLAWVLGGGFASPFAAPGNNPTVYALDPNSPLRHQFQATDPLVCGTTKPPCDIPSQFTNITFVNQERSRFFRKYYSGLRLKTYHFSKSYYSYDCDPGYKNECEGVYNAYPGIFDITVGQDEQVTGGHLSRWLLRLDAEYPLPFVPGTYIFGGVNSAFEKNRNSDPVFLPGTSTTAISDPSVFQVKVPLRDRDNYRLGIGVDLLQVLTQARQGGNKNPAGAGTTPNPNPTPTPTTSATADSAKPN